MSKPMTHLQAFTSEDAKRGRVWQDETDDFRRVCNRLERRYRKGGRGWEQSDVQVASFDGVVTWADEPKTLTLAEAVASGRPFRRKAWAPLSWARISEHVYNGGALIVFVVGGSAIPVGPNDITACDYELMPEGGE